MKKKNISLVSVLICILLVFAGCNSNSNNISSDRVIIYTAAEDERIAYLQTELDAKFPEIEIVIQSLGTGQLLSKLQAEGKNTDCDIFYDLEVVNAEIILNSNPDLFADLSEYDFTVYDASVTGYTNRHHRYAVNGKTAGAFLINTNLLKEKGLPIPDSYDDMLKPEYKNLISMPSPKSSGTGYSYYNGMVTLLGEEAGLEYFEKLNPKFFLQKEESYIQDVFTDELALGLRTRKGFVEMWLLHMVCFGSVLITQMKTTEWWFLFRSKGYPTAFLPWV